MKTDILIVGSGVAGLYCALNLPQEKNVVVVTKNKARKSDSYLAQGGICVLRDENDYDAVSCGDELEISDIISQISAGDTVVVKNNTTGKEFKTKVSLSERQRAMLIAGGLLNYTKMNGKD